MTKELEKQFNDLTNYNAPTDEKMVIARFFNPMGAGTWYATEYDAEQKLFFGYVSLFNDYNNEWGYFSLDELENIQLPFGMGIERDRFFTQDSIANVCERDGTYYVLTETQQTTV